MIFDNERTLACMRPCTMFKRLAKHYYVINALGMRISCFVQLMCDSTWILFHFVGKTETEKLCHRRFVCISTWHKEKKWKMIISWYLSLQRCEFGVWHLFATRLFHFYFDINFCSCVFRHCFKCPHFKCAYFSNSVFI